MAAQDQDVEQRLRDLQRTYVDFLDDADDQVMIVINMTMMIIINDDYDDNQGVYDRVVRDMIENKENRIMVNVNDLRRAHADRAKVIQQNLPSSIDIRNIFISNCFASHICQVFIQLHSYVLLGTSQLLF